MCKTLYNKRKEKHVEQTSTKKSEGNVTQLKQNKKKLKLTQKSIWTIVFITIIELYENLFC